MDSAWVGLRHALEKERLKVIELTTNTSEEWAAMNLCNFISSTPLPSNRVNMKILLSMEVNHA